jgi:hypothetical protein
MHHLTVRVAWPDNRWTGTVCLHPSGNASCTQLERIRQDRKDDLEDRFAGKSWSDLQAPELPPCVAEAGGFMNSCSRSPYLNPNMHFLFKISEPERVAATWSTNQVAGVFGQVNVSHRDYVKVSHMSPYI